MKLLKVTYAIIHMLKNQEIDDPISSLIQEYLNEHIEA
jgi:hypothetical protein